MLTKILLLLYSVQQCWGTIYQLNESSYERMPPLFGLDDYQSCLRPTDGVYCVIRLQLQAGDEPLISMIQEYSNATQKHFNHTFIDRGVCVTKNCKPYLSNTTADLKLTLEACLNESVYTEHGLQAKLTHLFYCDTHGEPTVIDTSDWVIAGVTGLIVLVNIVGSIYDYILRRKHHNEKGDNSNRDDKSKGNPYLLSFSIFRNLQWLAYKSKNPKLEILKGLHGIRVIAIILMMFAHVFFVYGGFIDNPYDFEKSYDTAFMKLVVNGTMIVQLFFVMSGLLLAHKMQMAAEKTKITWMMVPKIVVFRWLRLTPANALMIAWTATWLRHVGSGPLWKLAVSRSVSKDCREYWWHYLLYINNYVGEQGKLCAPHAWYIAADTQLFLLGVVVLVAARGRWLAPTLGLLAAAGVVAPAAQAWKGGLGGVLIMIPEQFRSQSNRTFYYLHILGHNNMSALAVGMAAAVAMYKLHCSGHKFSKHKKFLRHLPYALPCASVLLVMALMYCGSALYLIDGEQERWIGVAYEGLHRLIVSLLAALGLASIALKFEGQASGLHRSSINVLRIAMEWDGWVVPSRLCYGAYILHMPFVFILIGTKTQLGHMSMLNLLTAHVSVVVVSFAAALPFCLAVEAPMIAITTHLRGGRHNKIQPAAVPSFKPKDEGLK